VIGGYYRIEHAEVTVEGGRLACNVHLVLVGSAAVLMLHIIYLNIMIISKIIIFINSSSSRAAEKPVEVSLLVSLLNGRQLAGPLT
jgi:hypothetical protein